MHDIKTATDTGYPHLYMYTCAMGDEAMGGNEVDQTPNRKK